MKKSIFLILMVLLSSSFKSEDKFDLTGVWVRVGDAWEGMQVKVIENETNYLATVTYLPQSAIDWGFSQGDIKWRIPKKGTGKEMIFSDLYYRRASTFSSYKYSKMTIVSFETVQTQLMKYSGETIGRKQTWVRVPSV